LYFFLLIIEHSINNLFGRVDRVQSSLLGR
jgi:hypothetical protein